MAAGAIPEQISTAPGNREDGLVEKDIRTFKAAEFHLMLFPSS